MMARIFITGSSDDASEIANRTGSRSTVWFTTTLGAVTQVWLATSSGPSATVTGEYFYQRRPHDVHPSAR